MTDELSVDIQDLANASGITILNYKESVVRVGDMTNKNIQEKVVSQTYSFPLIQTLERATGLADSILRETSYPLSVISFQANRLANRLQEGDHFKFNYSPYGIIDLPCLVTSIEEGDLLSETITINCIQSVYYATKATTINTNTIGSTGNFTPSLGGAVVPLTFVKVMETPYEFVLDTLSISICASRSSSSSLLGYQVHMSIDDGVSYNLVATQNAFAPYGQLVEAYPDTTDDIDDTIGLIIDSQDQDFAYIETITRTQLFTHKNLAILGDELISFQTITPHETIDNRYILTGIYRGRMDTGKENHPENEAFYFLSDTNVTIINDSRIVVGSELKFKLVPFSEHLGNIGIATVFPYTVYGRIYTPYAPINITVDGLYGDTTSPNVIIEWVSRLPGEGAGVGDPDTVVDNVFDWVGLFRVEIYDGETLVKTVEDIDAQSYTYTSYDSDFTMGSNMTVKIYNYIWEQNYLYTSDPGVLVAIPYIEEEIGPPGGGP